MKWILTAWLLAASFAPALAQAPAAPQGMPDMPHGPAVPDSAADRAYRRAMEDMHGAMGIPLTGDADRDFAAMMIPHHQAAVDMARTELRYGRDPEMRKLAREVIDAQQREMRTMRHWQMRHGQKHAR